MLKKFFYTSLMGFLFLHYLGTGIMAEEIAPQSCETQILAADNATVTEPDAMKNSSSDSDDQPGNIEDEVVSLRKQLKELSLEFRQMKDLQDKTLKDQEELKARDTVLERNQSNISEGVKGLKAPINFFGDITFWYHNTRVEDKNGGKGNSSYNLNIFRTGGMIPMAPQAYATYRFMIVQPTRQSGYYNTNFMLDMFSIDKGNMFGGDWRVGRQFVNLGNSVLLIDFMDGISYTIRHKKLISRALYVAQTLDPPAGTTHGLKALALYCDYELKPKHHLFLTHFHNPDKSDKNGVTSPQTSENWFALEAQGTFNKNWNYFGTAAQYRNNLGANDVPVGHGHLRGDTNNTAALLGLKYDKPKKFNAGLIWANYLNNFRPISIVNALQNRGIQVHPLEDTLVGLSEGATNARTGSYETLFPPSPATASPYNTPINAPGENRASGGFLGDIHGYRDVQLSAQYYFRHNLSFKLIQDWMVGARSSYNYADVNITTARLKYQICPVTHLELRAIRLVSDYGRAVNDLKTEFFMRF